MLATDREKVTDASSIIVDQGGENPRKTWDSAPGHFLPWINWIPPAHSLKLASRKYKENAPTAKKTAKLFDVTKSPKVCMPFLTYSYVTSFYHLCSLRQSLKVPQRVSSSASNSLYQSSRMTTQILSTFCCEFIVLYPMRPWYVPSSYLHIYNSARFINIWTM